jgi:integrase
MVGLIAIFIKGSRPVQPLDTERSSSSRPLANGLVAIFSPAISVVVFYLGVWVHFTNNRLFDRLKIRRADTRSDAGARTVELNRDATDAATRLLMRAVTLMLPAKEPEHYLMPKHLSRIAYGEPGRARLRPHSASAVLGHSMAQPNRKGRFSQVRFHDLRHTFITHMVELGVSIGVIPTFRRAHERSDRTPSY